MKRPKSGVCRIFSTLGAILIVAATLPAADKKDSGPQNAQHGSTLRVDAGTLYTASGVPIQLHSVVANIVKHSPGQAQDQNHDHSQEKKGGGSAQNACPDPPKNSEVVTIIKGDVTLTSNSLTKLLNQKIKEQGKLKDLKVTTDAGKQEVHIAGKAKKIIDVPFDLKGPVKATSDGQIRFDAQSVKAADIPGLAGLLGLTVQKAAGTNAAKGVKTQQNTIIFNPDQLWGLPVHGAVTKVAVQKNGLLLVFGQAGQGGNQQHQPPEGKTKKMAGKH